MNINLSTNIENYKVISEECYYADKTLLIKEIIDFPSGSAIYIQDHVDLEKA